MAQRISQQQLESYLWGAATLLRGTIDAGDYKQFIFPLLFYKRLCDVFDEETQTALAESDGDEQFSLFPENHRFQIPPEAHWRRVRQTAVDVGRALQNVLRAIETANPDKLYGIFGDAQWTNKDRLSDAMLRDLVEHFSALELSVANLPEDELGQGYEYLTRNLPTILATPPLIYFSTPETNGQVQVSVHGSLPDALAAWLASTDDVRAALATILGTDAVKETSVFSGKPVQTLPAWIKRDEWKRLPFGAFAQNVNERVEPSQAGDEIYVGLEHLDPQDLHIRRWGKGSDVIGTKLRFRKGDLIFGRRRAYQRKLAVAEFDGICSAHAMVVRAKPDMVLPEFLPFPMMSDRFMNRAVEISVGSLSPIINWTTLKLEEFAFPPLDQQRRIAEILWAVDEVRCMWDRHECSLTTLHKSRLQEVFGRSEDQWLRKALEDIARVERGKFSHRPRNLPEFYGGSHPFVQTGDVQNANRLLTKFEYSLTDLGTTYSKSFPAGTIFVSIAAVIGATAISDREVFVTDSVVGVVPASEMDVDYVELFLRSQRPFLENQAATQTAQKNINLQVLRPLQLPCPPRTVQKELAQQILAPMNAANVAREHIARLQKLLAALSNTLTGTQP